MLRPIECVMFIPIDRFLRNRSQVFNLHSSSSSSSEFNLFFFFSLSCLSKLSTVLVDPFAPFLSSHLCGTLAPPSPVTTRLGNVVFLLKRQPQQLRKLPPKTFPPPMSTPRKHIHFMRVLSDMQRLRLISKSLYMLSLITDQKST